MTGGGLREKGRREVGEADRDAIFKNHAVKESRKIRWDQLQPCPPYNPHPGLCLCLLYLFSHQTVALLVTLVCDVFARLI